VPLSSTFNVVLQERKKKTMTPHVAHCFFFPIAKKNNNSINVVVVFFFLLRKG
jgi:hypothetical protein